MAAGDRDRDRDGDVNVDTFDELMQFVAWLLTKDRSGQGDMSRTHGSERSAAQRPQAAGSLGRQSVSL